MKRDLFLSLGRAVVLAVSTLAFASIVAAQGKPQVPETDVVRKSIKAVGYEVGGGSTKVIFIAAPAAPNASGEAKVDAKKGSTDIEVKVKGMPQPTTLGAEFLTYVLWIVTPDGSTTNLGEIPIDKNGEGKLNTSAQSQTFAMGVTAEPYFAVSLPSEIVVLVNDTTKNTKGKIYPDNSYKLMKRSQYARLGNPLALTLDLKNVPLDMYEARNAVDIARSQGAEKYAPEIFSKASGSLQMAENTLASKSDKSKVLTNARQTIQFAEDARALSAERQEAERIQQEKDAAAATAKAKAEEQAAADAADAKRKADAEAAEAKRKSDAEIAAREEAIQAALREKQQLRVRLLEQFNRVLPTTDTPRGLVVNMGDVLFDTGKSDLRSEAREAMAKLSGIVLNYPSLHLTIEGHTDSTGSPEFNQTLSQKRADAVRDYLVSQGLDTGALSAQGLGMENPVAHNSTAEGRQKNRRVEIIVSGEVIGTELGGKTSP